MLTLKYRPTTFSDVVGQHHVIPVLRALVQRGATQSPCLLFSGDRATGKTSVARILAAALNCGNSETGDACGQCLSCISTQTGSNPSVVELDAASNGGVADVHRLRDLCQYAPPGAVRVIIVDEAQSLSQDAQEALLRILEEPPAQTLFLLLTTHPEKISKPVVSRSLPFDFRPIPLPLVVQRLTYIAQAESISVDGAVVERIAQDTSGHLREAILRLDQCALADVSTAEQYEKIFGEVDVSLPILDSVTRGDTAAALALVAQFFETNSDMRRLSAQLAQALILVAEASAGSPTEASASVVAQRVSRDRIISAIHVVWDFTDRIHWAPNDRSLADMLVVMLGKVLVPGIVMQAQDNAAILESEDESSEEAALAFLRENGLID